MLESLFQLNALNSSVRTELIAGFTTFLTLGTVWRSACRFLLLPVFNIREQIISAFRVSSAQPLRSESVCFWHGHDAGLYGMP